MATHCLPNGYLGTNELPVPNISGATITTYNPASGLRRGVIVYHHGLYLQSLSTPYPPGGQFTDNYNLAGSAFNDALCKNLASDGWVVLAVPAQEDTYVGVPSAGMQSDVNSDSTYGARYLASTLHTWDHIYQYIQQVYGNWPVISGGFSLGGWRSTSIAQARPQQLVGSFSHQPATVFENVTSGYTPGSSFATTNFSGLNDTATELNAITSPALIGYSISDSAAWSGGNSTLATVNGATTTVNASAVTSLTVSGGSTNFYSVTDGTGYLLVTSGTGRGVYTYSMAAASPKYTPPGTFTAVTPVAGSFSGTIGVGATVVQSYIDSFCTNAVAAGKSVTRNAGTDVHGLSLGFTGAYTTAGFTLSAGSNTGLSITIPATQALTPLGGSQGLIAGACAIQDNTGVWRPITAIGGLTSTQLTGVTITGPATGTATIAANAPICNTGTAITGGYSNMSIPYWVNTVLSPSYPRTY
jgi:hypothetical protein